MFGLARRRNDVPAHVSEFPSTTETDIACLKERDAALARRLGLPSVGARLTNEHGIEWTIDGYTSASSLSTMGRGLASAEAENLYPVVIPTVLSEPVQRLLDDINLCTPKDIVPLDTMPYLRKGLALPHTHSVDSMSDPCRILMFIDVERLHEAALAHELGHLWIEFVEGVEDYRVYRDEVELQRYIQVQQLQSFVLDVKVDRLLRNRGVDVAPIEKDRDITLQQLAQSVEDGYTPPTPWESVFIATLLAETIAASGSFPVRYSRESEILQSTLAAEWNLAHTLADIVRLNPLATCRDVEDCVNQVLTHCFAHAGEHFDPEEDLARVDPAVEWRDKWPGWLEGLQPYEKSEVGRALAKSGLGLTAHVRLSPSGSGTLAEFSIDGQEWMAPQRLPFVTRLHIKPFHTSRDRIVMPRNLGTRKPLMNIPNPQLPHLPGGRRTYSTGMGRFLTQVRMQEQLAGERPYTYANNNPLKYVDPLGLSPCDIPPHARGPIPQPGGDPWPEGVQRPRTGIPNYNYWKKCIEDGINKHCKHTLAKYFGSESNAYSLFPYVFCIIDGESNWNPTETTPTNSSKNPGNAYGMMQITHDDLPTCNKYGYDWANDPCDNIKCGIAILCNCLWDNKGNVGKCFGQFNAIGNKTNYPGTRRRYNLCLEVQGGKPLP